MAQSGVSVVVDTSVMCAAGVSDAPSAAHARMALSVIRASALRIAVAALLLEEWRLHMSTFSRKWLVSMYSRKHVVRVQPLDCPSLIEAVALLEPPSRRNAADKDAHLLQTALAADRRVVSFDDKARRFFSEVAVSCHEIRSILWANPAEQPCIDWLGDHAPDRLEFRLHQGTVD